MMHTSQSISSRILGAGLALVMSVSLLSPSAFAEGAEVSINEANFPDQNFRTYVETSFDEDQNKMLSEKEIDHAVSIRVHNMEISDLKGVEYFTSLRALTCSSNHISKLDLSNNSDLMELDCGSNELTELDLRGNPKLEVLQCYSNQLTELDLSANPALKMLNCRYNLLTNLNISGGSELTELLAEHNGLTQLDVSNHPLLNYIECNKNQLTSLDVTKNGELVKLECNENQLTELDLHGNPKLQWLSCDNNQLTELDLSANTAMENLYCRDNQLTVVNVSGCSMLEDIFGSNNHVTSLDLHKDATLRNVNFSNNFYDLDQRENFDCSRLPGHFDSNRVTEVRGGKFDTAKNTFSFDQGVDEAVYLYDAGNGDVVAFCFTAEHHEHTFSTDWTSDATHHWHGATCEHKDQVSDKAAHTFGEWTVTLKPTTEKEGLRERSCDICGYKQEEILAKLPPVNPEKPTEPSKPAPTDPTTPDQTKPSDPTKPSESKPTDPTQKPDSTKPTAPAQKPNGSKPVGPHTGDSSNVMLWTSVIVVCVVVLGVTIFLSKKKSR